LTNSATQVAPLHHCVVSQSLSCTHAVPQAPVDSQTVPAWTAPAAAHVVVPPTVPQVVQAAPPPGQ
jgi:hypothetical protein